MPLGFFLASVGAGVDPVEKPQHGPAKPPAMASQPNGALLQGLEAAGHERPAGQSNLQEHRWHLGGDLLPRRPNYRATCTPENYCDCLFGTRQQALNGLLSLSWGKCGQLF